MSGHIPDAKSSDWCTPKWIVDAVRSAFEGWIDLDPCSNPGSLVGANESFIIPHKDGLKEPWGKRTVYVNPPYGFNYNKIGTNEYITYKEFKVLEDPNKKSNYKRTSLYDWMQKCAIENEKGASIITLIPAYTDSKAWQDLIFQKAAAICFIRGRVDFQLPNGNTKNSAPMACALVYWSPNILAEDPYFVMEKLEELGHCVYL